MKKFLANQKPLQKLLIVQSEPLPEASFSTFLFIELQLGQKTYTKQKQPFSGVPLKMLFWKIHRKTPLSQTVLNSITGLKPAGSLKKKLRCQCFPVNLGNFWKFSSKHIRATACNENLQSLSLKKQPFADVLQNSVLKNFTKFTGKHLRRSLCLYKLVGQACNFTKQKTTAQALSCEFCEI